MDAKSLLAEKITTYFEGRKIAAGRVGEGYCEIVVWDFRDWRFQPHNVIKDILKVADEYRRCEGIMNCHKEEADCDLRLCYADHNSLYLCGNNLRQESDLELMVRIRDESMQSPKTE